MYRTDMEPTIGELSHSLLGHDSLMTPFLTARFGSISARQRLMTFGESTFSRQSKLCRKSDGELILEATLLISEPSIPEAMLRQLQRDDTPFGLLLAEHGLATTIAERALYFKSNSDPTMVRWGRRHFILNADDESRICQVDELLVPEAELVRLSKSMERGSDGV
jgi:chorismate-pyruvate lyase